MVKEMKPKIIYKILNDKLEVEENSAVMVDCCIFIIDKLLLPMITDEALKGHCYCSVIAYDNKLIKKYLYKDEVVEEKILFQKRSYTSKILKEKNLQFLCNQLKQHEIDCEIKNNNSRLVFKWD